MRRRKARLLLVSGEHLSCWICVQFWTSGLCFRNCSSRNWKDNGGLGFFSPGTQCFVLITSNVCIRIIAAKFRKGEEERRVDRVQKYTSAYVRVCIWKELYARVYAVPYARVYAVPYAAVFIHRRKWKRIYSRELTASIIMCACVVSWACAWVWGRIFCIFECDIFMGE